jgi:beta-glucosidase/6-phospho-beta-glucosidase/beta-galactosidase
MARPHFPHLGAFESTKLSESGTDILGTTRHMERWRHDLELLRSSGITQLRYSVPWHRIERNAGEFDFRWLDGPMQFMRDSRMRPILDPLHHISFPDWLTGGMSNPLLAGLYERFVLAVARRYDWATEYTVLNEPLPTTIFCGYRGLWYPYGCSDGEFVRMAVNVARTICRVSAALLKHNPNIRLVHIDTCETHRALDRQSEGWVEHANERRYLMHELILGRITRSHPLFAYLAEHGFTDDDMHWLADHPAHIDVLGLDYYMHCEMEWRFEKELNRPNIACPR